VRVAVDENFFPISWRELVEQQQGRDVFMEGNTEEDLVTTVRNVRVFKRKMGRSLSRCERDESHTDEILWSNAPGTDDRNEAFDPTREWELVPERAEHHHENLVPHFVSALTRAAESGGERRFLMFLERGEKWKYRAVSYMNPDKLMFDIVGLRTARSDDAEGLKNPDLGARARNSMLGLVSITFRSVHNGWADFRRNLGSATTFVWPEDSWTSVLNGELAQRVETEGARAVPASGGEFDFIGEMPALSQLAVVERAVAKVLDRCLRDVGGA
jgi:hypothetical protein